MKKIILSGFLCLTFTASAQKEYFSIIGKTFVEEHIVPDHTTTSPLGGGTYIRVKEIPKRGWLADAEGYFRIDSLRRGKYHLTFSYIGLEPVDTALFIDNDVDLKITLSNLSISTPQLSLILPEKEICEVLKRTFWTKYGIRGSFYTKESLQDKSQRMTAIGYFHEVRKNQIIFDYLDTKYGYSWRYEAPKGIIGLDETLDTYEIFTR